MLFFIIAFFPESKQYMPLFSFLLNQYHYFLKILCPLFDIFNINPQPQDGKNSTLYCGGYYNNKILWYDNANQQP